MLWFYWNIFISLEVNLCSFLFLWNKIHNCLLRLFLISESLSVGGLIDKKYLQTIKKEYIYYWFWFKTSVIFSFNMYSFLRFSIILICWFAYPRLMGTDSRPWYFQGEELFLYFLPLVLGVVEPVCFIRYCREKKWISAGISFLFVIMYFWILRGVWISRFRDIW